MPSPGLPARRSLVMGQHDRIRRGLLQRDYPQPDPDRPAHPQGIDYARVSMAAGEPAAGPAARCTAGRLTAAGREPHAPSPAALAPDASAQASGRVEDQTGSETLSVVLTGSGKRAGRWAGVGGNGPAGADDDSGHPRPRPPNGPPGLCAGGGILRKASGVARRSVPGRPRYAPVSVDVSSLSGILAAYVDLPGVGVRPLGPVRPFSGGGLGAARVATSTLSMFPGTSGRREPDRPGATMFGDACPGTACARATMDAVACARWNNVKQSPHTPGSGRAL